MERAGYSRRTFANHFSCKEEAVAAVAFGGVDDAGAILADLPEDLPLLDALLSVMRGQFTADTLVMMRELMAMARQYPTLEPYVLSVQQRMRHTAQELLGSAAGDRYPAIYVPLLFGAVYGAVMAALATVRVATVVVLAPVPVAAARSVAMSPRPTAATSPQKPPELQPQLRVQTLNPPLSASAKPRQLQQLTVPRPSNRSFPDAKSFGAVLTE